MTPLDQCGEKFRNKYLPHAPPGHRLWGKDGRGKPIWEKIDTRAQENEIRRNRGWGAHMYSDDIKTGSEHRPENMGSQGYYKDQQSSGCSPVVLGLAGIGCALISVLILGHINPDMGPYLIGGLIVLGVIIKLLPLLWDN